MIDSSFCNEILRAKYFGVCNAIENRMPIPIAISISMPIPIPIPTDDGMKQNKE